MNKASFLSLVRDTSRISDQDAEALEQLVVNFPYCQTAHLLIAKAAYDRGSMLSNQKLKKAAIYATNRQLLKKLIYTSDATVALHPLPAPETIEKTVAETPEKVSPENLVTVIPEVTAAKAASGEQLVAPISEVDTPEITEAEVHQETYLSVVNQTGGIENKEPEKEVIEKTSTELPEDYLAEAVLEEAEIAEHQTETGEDLRETDSAAEVEKPAEEAELPIVAYAEELLGHQVSEAAIVAEEIAIAEELPEILPSENAETSAEPIADESIAAEPEGSALEIAETDQENSALENDVQPEESILAEPSEGLNNVDSDPLLVSEELPELSPVEMAETPEKTVPETTEKLPEFQEIPENVETELQDVPDLHEMQLTDEAQPVPFKVSALHDEMLQETLASFDRYLFKPEKDTEEPARPEENLEVIYPENEIEAIYLKDSIGYWMSSSRLGESLQVKNDLTTPLPFDFHPELLLEYTKTHDLEKQLKPAPSPLTRQLDIIDQFLKQSPRIKPGANLKIKTEAQEDLSQKSTKINKNMASENFANILVQQGKIKKAIKIYEHLILKIPEKKAYFVAQIEKLQNPE